MPSEFSLEGMDALVIGGSGVLGRAAAVALAEAGANVGVTTTTRAKGEEVVANSSANEIWALNRKGFAQAIDAADEVDVRAAVLADRRGIPPGASHEMLDAIRGGIPHGFGDLPAVFALDGAEQPTERRPHAVLGFAPSEVGHEPTFHFGLPERPGLDRREGDVRRGWTQLLPQFHNSILI